MHHQLTTAGHASLSLSHTHTPSTSLPLFLPPALTPIDSVHTSLSTLHPPPHPHPHAQGDTDRKKSMSVLLHGDAAFSGQGVVFETMGLSDLHDYSTGEPAHLDPPTHLSDPPPHPCYALPASVAFARAHTPRYHGRSTHRACRRRHHPHRCQQSDRLHHRPALLPLLAVLHRRRQGDPGADLSCQRRRHRGRGTGVPARGQVAPALPP